MSSFGPGHATATQGKRLNLRLFNRAMRSAKSTAADARFIMTFSTQQYLHHFARMQIEIVCEAVLIDFIGKGFDAGMRLQRAVPPEMIAAPAPIAHMRLAIVGSPAYLRELPAPVLPRNLLTHDCILYRISGGRISPREFARDKECLRLVARSPDS